MRYVIGAGGKKAYIGAYVLYAGALALVSMQHMGQQSPKLEPGVALSTISPQQSAAAPPTSPLIGPNVPC